MSIIPLNTAANANKRSANGKMRLALIGLLIAMLVANFAIYNYETHLATAEKVLLKLAPVDPRSMMQGDYMALDYAISDQIMEATKAQLVTKDNKDHADNDKIYNLSLNGLAVIKKDTNGVAHFVRLTENAEGNDSDIRLAKDELLLLYRIRHGQLKIATNAFFFQEGHAEAFEPAEYGLFRINKQGQPLLTDMVDANFEVIDPANSQENNNN